jgi:hypothetical protein
MMAWVALGDGLAAGLVSCLALWPWEVLARPLPSKPRSHNPRASGSLPWPFLLLVASLLTTTVEPWGPLPAGAALVAMCTAVLASGPVAHIWNGRRATARLAYALPDWLAALALAVEVGTPLPDALTVAAAGCGSQLRGPASRLAQELQRGATLDSAWPAFQSAVPLPEIRFVGEVLERHRIFGHSLQAVLLREEGLLSRLRWLRHRSEEQLLPYAFAVSGGVLLTNAFLVLILPRIVVMISSLAGKVPL